MAEAIGSEDLRFVKGSSHRIVARPGAFDQIQDLRGRYYRHILNRPKPVVDRFVDETTYLSWADPNQAVNTRSRYAKPRAMVSYRGDQLTGVVLMANNASSKRSGLRGAFEERLKLYSPFDTILGLPPIIESRYVAIREVIGDEDAVVMAGMAAHLLGDFRDEQPVTDYLFDDEQDMRAALESWGMHIDGEPELIHPFGGLAEPDHYTRMLADTALGMKDTMTQDPAVARMVAQIDENVVVDSGSGVMPHFYI